MVYLLIVILHDLSRLPTLLQAWKKIGVPGVTLIHSLGGYQAESWLDRIGFGGLGRLLEQGEAKQRTLFSVIADEELLELAIAEADAVVEGFDRPHSGILFTLPVGRALGIRKRGHDFIPPEEDILKIGAEMGSVTQNMQVSQAVKILNLKPLVVQTHETLQDIVSAMLSRPEVQMACVVNEEQHLVGTIDLTHLANGFFFSIFPEKFISELQDLSQVMDFASQTRVRLAADLMQEPVWVKMEDDLEKAFELMHMKKLPGLPVVDDHYHVVGFINLLALLGAYLRTDTPGMGAGE